MEHNARAYVDGSIKSGREKRYIACQGPLASTCNDFWHMIWEERISVIVMLTKLKENERVRSRYLPHEINAYTRGRRSYAAAMLFQCKCFQYWPDDEPEAYGSVTVIPSDTKSLSDSIVLRTFLLFHGEVGGSREAPRVAWRGAPCVLTNRDRSSNAGFAGGVALSVRGMARPWHAA